MKRKIGDKMLCCRWCGEDCDDVSQIDRTADGFFCEICDGFTFYSDKENVAHRMLLLLEHKGMEQGSVAVKKGRALRKRVSPLRYPGGKSKLIDFIYERLQRDNMDTFVEVFAGGASLGLSLMDAGYIRRLVLNDTDPMLFAFWQTIVENPKPLVDRINGPLPTHDDFWAAKEVLIDCRKGCYSPAELAWAFFLLNRTCFSGVLMANPLGGLEGAQEQFLSRWNPSSLIERIERVHKLAPAIELYNMDCCEFLEQIVYWSDHTTLFIDPPYVAKGSKLYPHAFCEEDHRRLANLLNSLHVGFGGPDIVITYDDCEFVRELYPYAVCEEVSRSYSIVSSGCC